MIGFFRPKWRTLGKEFAGEVETVGSAVTDSPSVTACSG